MKWSNTAPQRGKVLSKNVIKLLSRLKGAARKSPPTEPTESWNFFFDEAMLQNITQFPNKRIDLVAAKYNKCKKSKNARRTFSPTFIKNTDKMEIEALIGLLYLQGCLNLGTRT